jgi:hypothetical protein
VALLRILDEIVAGWQEPGLQILARRRHPTGGIVLLEPPAVVDEQALAAGSGGRRRRLASVSGEHTREHKDERGDAAFHAWAYNTGPM